MKYVSKKVGKLTRQCGVKMKYIYPLGTLGNKIDSADQGKEKVRGKKKRS